MSYFIQYFKYSLHGKTAVILDKIPKNNLYHKALHLTEATWREKKKKKVGISPPHISSISADWREGKTNKI